MAEDRRVFLITGGAGFIGSHLTEKLLHDRAAGKVNHRLLIWSLLCFEWWNRQFIDRPSI